MTNMTQQQARETLSLYRNREDALAADDVEAWDEAWMMQNGGPEAEWDGREYSGYSHACGYID